LEVFQFLIDFILHVDKHLAAFVASYGPWVYALLFIIVFVETGVVVMPFLPGDSLLFVVGALSGAGLMSFPLACAVLLVAAILGDQCNYSIGRYFGPKVFQWDNSRWFNKRASCWRDSCPSSAPSPRSWQAWRPWAAASSPPTTWGAPYCG
jgi:membrane-associated protein